MLPNQLSPGKDGYLHRCAALLNEALRVLIATKIHRVYIAADGDKLHVPRGVVSLTDVIRFVLRVHK